MTYERILVPTDGSSTAKAAFRHAIELASQYDAEIHALYVVDTDSMSITLGPEQVDRIRQGHFAGMTEIRDRAENAVEEVAEMAEERGIDCTTDIRGGRPHEKIRDYAEEEGIDLVVIGSAGRGGIKRRILGSVTERVLRCTTVPVFVIDEKGETSPEEKTPTKAPTPQD